jgi:hypothetical protein
VTIGDHRLMRDGGLKELFESPGVMKVIHDSRQAADMLLHRFGVKLANVYDTLAAHLVFTTWSVYAGYMCAYAPSVNNLIRCYFGVKGRWLFFPHVRQSHQKEDTALWLQRPLPPHLEFGAVTNALFLLDLQRATRECMNRPFILATEALLSNVRDVSKNAFP